MTNKDRCYTSHQMNESLAFLDIYLIHKTFGAAYGKVFSILKIKFQMSFGNFFVVLYFRQNDNCLTD